MTDAPDDPDFDGLHLSTAGETDPLRERMRRFVAEHEMQDPVNLRESVRSGDDLSTLVRADRDDRL